MVLYQTNKSWKMVLRFSFHLTHLLFFPVGPRKMYSSQVSFNAILWIWLNYVLEALKWEALNISIRHEGRLHL